MNRAVKILTLTLCTLSILLTISLSMTHASSGNIIFVDAFWGEPGSKLEVNPGDKNVPLTVQLANARKEQIIGVRGYLMLPDGFVDSLTGSKRTRESASTQAVPSGGSFMLRYLIDIQDNAAIGLHRAYVVVSYLYYDGDEEDLVSSSSYVYVDIRVTGKSNVVVIVEDVFLIPGTVSESRILVSNDGTADIHDVQIQIGEPDIGGITVFDTQRSIRLSRLESGSKISIPIKLKVEDSVRNVAFRIPVSISYLDPYGQQRSLKQNAMFRVGSELTERVRVDASVEDAVLSPASKNAIKLILKNSGREPVFQIDVEVSLPQSLPAPLTFVKDAGRWSIDFLNPGEERVIHMEIFASQQASGKSYLLTLRASYSDIYNNRYSDVRTIGVRVADEPTMKSFKLTSVESLTSGTINMLEIRMENLRSGVLKNVSVTLKPSVDWLTILGGEREYYAELLPREVKSMEVSIFVPEQTREKVSTAGYAVYIDVRIDYVDRSGTLRMESYRIGYYVKGIIDITLQEIYVEFINERPYLVGRMLNEGNEPALFTKVSLIDSSEGLVALRSVYLGDLNPNAPLMFNIPVAIVGNLTGRDVSVKVLVEYKDSLRQAHSEVFEQRVTIPELKPSTEKGAPLQPSTIYLAILGIIIFILAISIVTIRVKKRRGSSTQSGMPSEVLGQGR